MISDVYFPRVNGVSTSTATFITELKALGHHVTLITPEYSSKKVINIDIEAGIIRVPSRKVLFDPEDRFMIQKHVHKILPQLREKNFDLIHIQTPFVAHYLGMWLSRELELPSLVTYHTFFEEYLFHYLPVVPKKWMRYFARYFTLKQCNQTEHIVVPSSAMRKVLSDYGVTTPMTILPTGIPLREFGTGNREQFRKQYGINEDRPVITTIGRVAFEKNLDFLLDVVVRIKEQIPNILFLIAGEGPMLNHLKKRVSKENLEDNVLFVGYLDREVGLQACYKATDVFIFASRTETQGLVLLEAMAEGIPVVSTAEMGTKDVLREGQGCLISNEDTDEFSDKVVTLFNDIELRNTLSTTGKKYVKKWTASFFANKLSELYQELVQFSTLNYELESSSYSETFIPRIDTQERS